MLNGSLFFWGCTALQCPCACDTFVKMQQTWKPKYLRNRGTHKSTITFIFVKSACLYQGALAKFIITDSGVLTYDKGMMLLSSTRFWAGEPLAPLTSTTAKPMSVLGYAVSWYTVEHSYVLEKNARKNRIKVKKKNLADSTGIDIYIMWSIVRITAARDADAWLASGVQAALDVHCHFCGFGKLTLALLKFVLDDQLLRACNFGGKF